MSPDHPRSGTLQNEPLAGADSGPDDTELLRMCQDESSKHYGFSLLVKKHQRGLYAFVRRMITDGDETNDVLQDTFVKAWRSLHTFRGDARLSSWLHRIAYTTAIDHLKKMRRGLFVSQASVVESLSASLDHSEHFSGDAIERELQRAVMRLPDRQRAVFTLRYFQELPYAEISAITGTSVNSLKSSYHIAAKKIEQALSILDRTNAPSNGPIT